MLDWQKIARKNRHKLEEKPNFDRFKYFIHELKGFDPFPWAISLILVFVSFSLIFAVVYRAINPPQGYKPIILPSKDCKTEYFKAQ